MTYDYIIAGAGAAGCVLANRLSASGEHSVLLLEAGGKDSSWWFKIPVGFAKMYYNPTFNWMYYSQPQKQLADRAIYAPRGKVQGGSGSINAMIYVRGQAHDLMTGRPMATTAGASRTCCRTSASWKITPWATPNTTAAAAPSASPR